DHRLALRDEHRRLEPPPPEEHAVARAQILHPHPSFGFADARVPTGDLCALEPNGVALVPPDVGLALQGNDPGLGIGATDVDLQAHAAPPSVEEVESDLALGLRVGAP